jgi:hypothetical protein
MKRLLHFLSLITMLISACSQIPSSVTINLGSPTNTAAPAPTLLPPTQVAPPTAAPLKPTAAPPTVASPSAAPTTKSSTQDYITFSINTQEFVYTAQSIALLNRIVDLHEKHQVAVDIFLATEMTDIYESQAPDLLKRLKASPVVSISYHTRPPKPYHNDFDWLGLDKMSAKQQYDTIMNYETHGLDMVTGQPTSANGGYKKLKEYMGYAPYIASALSDKDVANSVYSVFKDLGAVFTIVHGRTVNVGDTQSGLYLKPEHVDLRLFEHVGKNVEGVITSAIDEAHNAKNAKAPYFIGVKMHDNDFIAEKSAWLTIYGAKPRKPPYNTSLKANLLTADKQAAMWTLYESTVIYVASLRTQGKVTPVNAPTMLAMVKK